jgi:hypothetical protein
LDLTENPAIDDGGSDKRHLQLSTGDANIRHADRRGAPNATTNPTVYLAVLWQTSCFFVDLFRWIAARASSFRIQDRVQTTKQPARRMPAPI